MLLWSNLSGCTGNLTLERDSQLMMAERASILQGRFPLFQRTLESHLWMTMMEQEGRGLILVYCHLFLHAEVNPYLLIYLSVID